MKLQYNQCMQNRGSLVVMVQCEGKENVKQDDGRRVSGSACFTPHNDRILTNTFLEQITKPIASTCSAC
jgi:hypothetical protein